MIKLNIMEKVDLIDQIKTIYPKIYVTETNNPLVLQPENDQGFIEYKRSLVECDEKKIEKYATQMRWRISENIKQYAIYYIGVDDDGTIIGLNQEETMICIHKFVQISKSIEASIIGLQIIYVHDKIVIRFGVKIKKIENNYLVDFDELS